MQTIITYPGGKKRFYPYMKPYFPKDIHTLIEPFFGGGSVSLSMVDDPDFPNIERVIGGDIASEVWAFWNGFKESPEEVYEIGMRWHQQWFKHHAEMFDIPNGVYNTVLELNRAKKAKDGEAEAEKVMSKLRDEMRLTDTQIKEYIELVAVSVQEGKDFWDWAQKVDCSQLTLPERAARLFIVNRISFSGMGDSGTLSKNKFREFEPFKFDVLLTEAPLMKKITVLNKPFQETMKYAYEDPNRTFIFLDPPYFKQESSGLYGRNGDTHKGFNHEEFAEFTLNMPVKWFVTYDDSIKVRKMFAKNTVNGPCYLMPFKIPGGYTMASKKADDALDGEEVFIANYNLYKINSDAELTDF